MPAGARQRAREGWNHRRERELARAYLCIVGGGLALGSAAAAFEFWSGVGVIVLLVLTGQLVVGWKMRNAFTGTRPYYWGRLGPVPFPSEMVIRSAWPERYVLGIFAVLLVAAGFAAYFATT